MMVEPKAGGGEVEEDGGVCGVGQVGGAGHKVMLLMEGRAHAYVFPSPGQLPLNSSSPSNFIEDSKPGCKKWDTCAPEAILHAMVSWHT